MSYIPRDIRKVVQAMLDAMPEDMGDHTRIRRALWESVPLNQRYYPPEAQAAAWQRVDQIVRSLFSEYPDYPMPEWAHAIGRIYEPEGSFGVEVVAYPMTIQVNCPALNGRK